MLVEETPLAKKPNDNKRTSDRSSAKKSESPWAKATGNKSGSRNNNQNRTQSGNR